MAAIAPIVINDGATTPVAHTFNPITSSDMAMYRENLVGLALAGQGSIVVTSKLGDLNKVRVVLALPVLETGLAQNALGYTAAPKVAYTMKANIDFILPNRSTSQQRKDLRTLLANAISNAQIIDAVDLLAQPY